jgi:hypothetical protein
MANKFEDGRCISLLLILRGYAVCSPTQLEGINIIQIGSYLGFQVQPSSTAPKFYSRSWVASPPLLQLDRAKHTFNYADTHVMCFTFLAAATCKTPTDRFQS